MTILSEEIPYMASNEVLALQQVLENAINIPLSSEEYTALKAFWIFNIHDLMNLHPQIDLQEEYPLSKVNENGESTEGYYKLPSMLIKNIELLQQWYFEVTYPKT